MRPITSTYFFVLRFLVLLLTAVVGATVDRALVRPAVRFVEPLATLPPVGMGRDVRREGLGGAGVIPCEAPPLESSSS